MDRINIPDWLVNYVGRQAIMAEAQRVQDAAAIAALQQHIQQLQAPVVELEGLVPVAEPLGNGAAPEAVGALED